MKGLLAAVAVPVFTVPVLAVLAVLLAATTLAAPPARPASGTAGQVAAAPPWLRPELLAAAAATRLPAALLTAIAEVESSFDPLAVGPPVPGGPALGLMQFLPSSWALFNRVPGATPFDPGPALLAAGAHLLASGATPGGGWDVHQALFGYNHSRAYVAHVLAVAASYGWTPGGPR